MYHALQELSFRGCVTRKCITPETLTDGHTRIANAAVRFQTTLDPESFCCPHFIRNMFYLYLNCTKAPTAQSNRELAGMIRSWDIKMQRPMASSASSEIKMDSAGSRYNGGV